MDNPEINIDKIKPQQSDSGSILIPQITLHDKTPERNIPEKQEGKKLKRKFVLGKKGKIIFGVLAAILLFFTVIALLLFDVYRKGKVLAGNVQSLETSAKEQNIEKLKSDLDNTRASLKTFEKSFSRIGFLRYTPFVGFYVSDAKHGIKAAGYSMEAGEILIDAMAPYADIIGFNSGDAISEAESAEQTTQERLDFVVKTLPDLVPKDDSLIEKATLIKEEIDQIDPHKYPEKIGDKEIRSKLESLVELVDQSVTLIQNGK